MASCATAAAAAPVESNGTKKRPFQGKGQWKPKNKKQKAVKEHELRSSGSHDEVLLHDVNALLEKFSLDSPSDGAENGTSDQTAPTTTAQPELFSEVELTVSEISSTGDGLAISPDRKHVYVVPSTVPGDVVRAKIFRRLDKERYSLTDFLGVKQPGPRRDDSLIKCKYFASCGGCQFQMLPYEDQLAHKKTIVEKAYKNFSNLDPALVPPVGDTIGSPLQYGYRTKLTPHFDGPPGKKSDGRNGIQRVFTEVPNVGFMKKGTRHTLDIEDCPIGTPAVVNGLRRERKRVAAEIHKYRKGATILLRENTTRFAKADVAAIEAARQADPDAVIEAVTTGSGEHVHVKTCITDNNAESTEYIGDWVFRNPAGAFFQNNNSILPRFTDYVAAHILPPPDANSTSTSNPQPPPITHLIDAYSGSGLFTITLSPHLPSSLGIDISAQSIASATQNLHLNHLSPSRASFHAADAAHLFRQIRSPPAHTVVLLDPPRKGCDASFLRQLLAYGPARILYVSCNVHTQARDVGILVGGMQGVGEGGAYVIDSLVGFDFFPQTGHVEGVAVLRRVAPFGRWEPEGKEQEKAETEVNGTAAATAADAPAPAALVGDEAASTVPATA